MKKHYFFCVFFFLGVGWGQMVANASVVSYYTCLIALAVYYLTASFSSVLPWMVCDHNMTRPGSVCVASGGFGNSTTYDENGKKLKVISAAEQYFK